MKSIRARLTLWLVSAFAILFTGVNGLVYFSSRQFLYHEFDGALKAKAMAINTLIKQVDGKLLVDFSDKFLTGFGEKAGTEFFEVWLPEGTVLRRSSSLAGADLPRKVGTPNLPLFWNLFSVSGFPVRAVGLDFTARMDLNERQHHPPTEAMIVVASDRRELDRSLSGLALTLTIATILGVILTVPVVHLTLRRGHEPLDRLGHAASAIHAEFLEFRFSPNEMPRELQPIASRLNDLLERLQEAFERERRFGSDLAHELRTPLAELRTHAEVEADCDGDRADAHRETLKIAMQMESMVTRLLSLARSQNKKTILNIEHVEIAPVITEVWRAHQHRAEKRKLTVIIAVPQNLRVHADSVLLKSIVENLFSNAIEYAPEGGQIEVSGFNSGGHFELIVRNTISDLVAEDLPHLFDRFWRKNPARAAGEHSGLGLSLAKSFSNLQGWTLTAELLTEKILEFRISGNAYAEKLAEEIEINQSLD